MRKLLAVTVVLASMLAIGANDALAQRGGRGGRGQQGMQGRAGMQQAYGWGQSSATGQRYQMQNRVRLRQYQSGTAQQPMGYGTGWCPYTGEFGALEAQAQPYGLGAGQCPYGNQPGAMRMYQRQNRYGAGQSGLGNQSGGAGRRARTRTRVPQ
ncbi:MAG: hypothetical protein HQ582_26590 [Planctomycetes bacterium]|nr:hypothetical protein [Planctomycetota bacterium]